MSPTGSTTVKEQFEYEENMLILTSQEADRKEMKVAGYIESIGKLHTKEERLRKLNTHDRVELLREVAGIRKEIIKNYDEVIKLRTEIIDELAKQLDKINALSLPLSLRNRKRSSTQPLAANLQQVSKEHSNIHHDWRLRIQDYEIGQLGRYVSNEQVTKNADPTRRRILQTAIKSQYDAHVAGAIFSDQEAALHRTFEELARKQAAEIEEAGNIDQKDSCATLKSALQEVLEFHKQELAKSFSDEQLSNDPKKLGAVSAEYDAIARYTRHLILINRVAERYFGQTSQDNNPDIAQWESDKYLATMYQMKELFAQAQMAAEMANGLESDMRHRLKETISCLSDAVDWIVTRYGDNAQQPRGENEEAYPDFSRLETFPAQEKQVVLETFAGMYANFSAQYHLFTDSAPDPEKQKLFAEMIKNADELESRVYDILGGAGMVSETAPVTSNERVEILQKHGLLGMVIGQSLSIVEEPDKTTINDVQPKGQKKKGKKPQISAPSKSGVSERPREQEGRATENAPGQDPQSDEDLTQQDEDSLSPEWTELKDRIKSLRGNLREKEKDWNKREAREREIVERLQKSPASRKSFSPEQIVISPQLLAGKAKGIVVLCEKLAASDKRAAELIAHKKADFYKEASKCEEKKEHYQKEASTYEKQAEAWRIERTKECLASAPSSKLFFEPLLNKEIERIDGPRRLPHATIVKGSDGACLLDRDGNFVYDLVLEDKVALKGGHKFVVHRHFQSTKENATADELLGTLGNLVAHSLKTTEDAPLGSAYKKRDENIKLWKPEAKRAAAEKVQNRLNELRPLLEQKRKQERAPRGRGA